MKKRKKTGTIFLVIFSIMMVVMLLRANDAYSQMNAIGFTGDSLPNGLIVIYHIDKSAPVVSSVVHYKVGSFYEQPDKTGYAHFFEHLMFEGTKNIPRAKITDYTLEAGGELNAHTSFEETVFYFTVPSNELKLALWIESQRMRGLLIDTIGVETQKGVVIEELKQSDDNQPYGTWLNKMMGYLFDSWSVIGYQKDLSRARISDFREFYDDFYHPNNAVLVISGDINLKTTRELVWKYFKDIPRGEIPALPDYKYKLNKSVNQTLEDELAVLPAIFIGLEGPKLGDTAYYAMELLSLILSEGNSSRFYQNLIEKKKVALQISFEPFSFTRFGGLLVAGVASQDISAEDLEEAVNSEFQKLVANGITSEELSKAKNMLEASFVSSKKSAMNKALELADYYAKYQNPSLINQDIKNYLNITRDDVNKYIKKYLATDKKVVLKYVPKKS